MQNKQNPNHPSIAKLVRELEGLNSNVALSPKGVRIEAA